MHRLDIHLKRLLQPFHRRDPVRRDGHDGRVVDQHIKPLALTASSEYFLHVLHRRGDTLRLLRWREKDVHDTTVVVVARGGRGGIDERLQRRGRLRRSGCGEDCGDFGGRFEA